jgi:hypothetical protein
MSRAELTAVAASRGTGSANPLSGYLRAGAAPSFAAALAALILLGCGLIRLVFPGPQAACGLEQWFGWGLERLIGPHPLALLPLTIAGMGLWWSRTRQPEQLPIPVMAGVLVESVLIALILTMLVRAARLLWTLPAAAAWTGEPGLWLSGLLSVPDVARVVSAAVHEEVCFRLLLLGGCLALMRRGKRESRMLLAGLTLGTALLFAGLHFAPFNPAGQPFLAADFACQFLLAVMLGAIFVTRGLALAIGVHCAYNVLSLG